MAENADGPKDTAGELIKDLAANAQLASLLQMCAETNHRAQGTEKKLDEFIRVLTRLEILLTNHPEYTRKDIDESSDGKAWKTAEMEARAGVLTTTELWNILHNQYLFPTPSPKLPEAVNAIALKLQENKAAVLDKLKVLEEKMGEVIKIGKRVKPLYEARPLS